MPRYVGPYWRRRAVLRPRAALEALCWVVALALPFFAFYVLPRVWP